MRFKKPKEEILQKMYGIYVYRSFNHNMADLSPNELKSAIEEHTRHCVQDGIRQVMDILMENIYTDEEFEKDINLVP